MHLRNEEIEAQNHAKLAELAISSEEKVYLSEIQNTTNTKICLPCLSNKNFHTLQSPKIGFPINTEKNVDFQDNKISNNFNEIENKNADFQEKFAQNNQTNYNFTEVRIPAVESFINQIIKGKETVLETSSAFFTLHDILK